MGSGRLAFEEMTASTLTLAISSRIAFASYPLSARKVSIRSEIIQNNGAKPCVVHFPKRKDEAEQSPFRIAPGIELGGKTAA